MFVGVRPENREEARIELCQICETGGEYRRDADSLVIIEASIRKLARSRRRVSKTHAQIHLPRSYLSRGGSAENSRYLYTIMVFYNERGEGILNVLVEGETLLWKVARLLAGINI